VTIYLSELLFPKIRVAHPNFWFVLAPSKDLAVSPQELLLGLTPQNTGAFALSGSGVSVRTSIPL